MTKTVVDDQTGDEEDEERFFVLRTFTVFNADQVEGPRRSRSTRTGQTDAQPDFAPAEELIAATKADIRYGGDRAYYRRPTPEGSFPNHTRRLHRAAAQGDLRPARGVLRDGDPRTGALVEVRTGWDHEKHGYALGELAAEIASCYVAAELGIPQGEATGEPRRLPEELAGGA